MAHISGHDRSQTLLFPGSVDDYVGPDNPVRFIDAFVDKLDLAAAGFVGVEPKATGRPGYAPADLLKLYIYGYLNRTRSSRRLEVETHRNIEVIWLLRHLKPDFETIADLRRDNRAAFKPIFREFALLCRQLDLFGRELLAIDGTRIKAVNNKDRNFTWASLEQFIRTADERLASYLQRLDDGDIEENGTGGTRVQGLAEKIDAIRAKRDRLRSLLADLDRSGESQVSLTDPDSRAMAAHMRVAVGYDAQVAVDAKHKLIVEQAVTNQVLDLGLLTQTAELARALLGVGQIEVVADLSETSGLRQGYFKFEDIGDLTKVDYSNRSACLACAFRPRCTKSFRRVSRLENEAVLDRMAARLRARPEVLDRRRETVEHPFGSIKQWMGQGAFLMKGLENVRAEFSLTALAYNMRRVINILGVNAMIVAVRT